jgi:hypothetical protein
MYVPGPQCKMALHQGRGVCACTPCNTPTVDGIFPYAPTEKAPDAIAGAPHHSERPRPSSFSLSPGQTYADAGDGCGDRHDSGDEMEEDEDPVSDRYDAAEAVMFNVSESRSSVRREARALDDAGEMD